MIESYWSRRAESYSEVVLHELQYENEQNWMRAIQAQIPADQKLKIADMGTGPGFFAIGLSKLGHEVTAVDYTQEMLMQARKNAGALAKKITWVRDDVQDLKLPDESFDVIVSRNLTWNLQNPAAAYREWYRVLKKGGMMLNFDAGWYNYLFDEKQQQAFAQDRERVKEAEVFDFESYEEGHQMEEIAKNLILSRCKRPKEDIRMLLEAGFENIEADKEIWREVWDDVEKINYASSPLFMLKAIK